MQPLNGASTVIPAGGLLVVEFCGSASYLVDSGDTVKLYNASNNLIDAHTYPATNNGKSHARIPDGADWVDPTPTPGDKNYATQAELAAEGWSEKKIKDTLDALENETDTSEEDTKKQTPTAKHTTDNSDDSTEPKTNTVIEKDEPKKRDEEENVNLEKPDNAAKVTKPSDDTIDDTKDSQNAPKNQKQNEADTTSEEDGVKAGSNDTADVVNGGQVTNESGSTTDEPEITTKDTQITKDQSNQVDAGAGTEIPTDKTTDSDNDDTARQEPVKTDEDNSTIPEGNTPPPPNRNTEEKEQQEDTNGEPVPEPDPVVKRSEEEEKTADQSTEEETVNEPKEDGNATTQKDKEDPDTNTPPENEYDKKAKNEASGTSSTGEQTNTGSDKKTADESKEQTNKGTGEEELVIDESGSSPNDDNA
jgi:hypothetical protein